MVPLNRRAVIVIFFVAILLVIWSVRLAPLEITRKWSTTRLRAPAGESRHVQDYLEQAFGDGPANERYEYTALREACAHTKFSDDVYVQCFGLFAGLTSIMSELKSCFKMAVDSGSNLVLPVIPIRDAANIKELNAFKADVQRPYDAWFDVAHLRAKMARACPAMKIAHPDELDKTVRVGANWTVPTNHAPGYQDFKSYFWAGQPYGPFFQGELAKLREQQAAPGEGITVAHVDPRFCLFRITDDPTGRDRRVWNDFAHLLRFRETERAVARRLLAALQVTGRPFYGVHFRVENDTIWSPLEHQLAADLDGLDRAWARWGRATSPQKPLVYLACGEAAQIDVFAKAATARGWDVTSKYALADAVDDGGRTRALLDGLAFDFQAAVDLAVMVRSDFFQGISGSAFSNTVAQLRDPTGRYRGSSFVVWDDGGARTHLHFDGNADGYPCCL